ncbi:MAG: hypothetical protein ACRED5_01270 [Propylenella sp.]
MSKIRALAVTALLVGSLASVGQAADRATQGGPYASPQAFPNLTGIYRASGVRDNGGAINTGVATSIHCTNFTAVTQQVRHVIRNFNGVITSNNTFNIPALRTHTASTHGTVAFNEDAFLSTGTLIEQGGVYIEATTATVGCTVIVIDASLANPVGYDLHLTRFNAASGSQE